MPRWPRAPGWEPRRHQTCWNRCAPRLNLTGPLTREFSIAEASFILMASFFFSALLGLIFLGRPTIRILFEHGKFDAAAGSLTYSVLVVYAVALPAYVGTEVITRGLIALRDTRTPLLTNTLQLAGRAAILALLIGKVGVVAIPIAFAVTAAIETVTLETVLLLKMQHWMKGSNPAMS